MWKYVFLWVLMCPIAIVNGALRELWYGSYLTELRAHQVSTATGIVLMGVYIWFALRAWMPRSAGQAMKIGWMWLILTVAFEFFFGHYAAGHSWQRLLADYNILEGRVWLLALIWLASAPYLVFRLERMRTA